MFLTRKLRRLLKIVSSGLVLYIMLVYISIFTNENQDNIKLDKRANNEQEYHYVASHIDHQKNGYFNQSIHNKDNLLNKEKPVILTKQAMVLKRVDSANGSCPSLLPHITPGLSDQWYNVISGKVVTHIYSAYYDHNNKSPLVRVMAISSGTFRQAVCQIWLVEGEMVQLHVVSAQYNIIPEVHGFKFAPYMFQCEIPERWKDKVPTHVSIVQEMCAKTNMILPIHKPIKPKYNFTVCLTPVNRGYANLGEFLEFVEINGMFGADHFILYNESIGKLLNPFIDMYKQEDKVEVVDWTLPVETKQGPMNQIHYFGQVIAINDCLYKSRLHSKFVVFIDLDEIIVPMKHNNWISYIEHVNKGRAGGNSGQKFGDYMFKNVFFREEWEPDPKFKEHPLVKKLNLRSLLYAKRETRIWSHRMRSKYIGIPNAIQIAGIHTPWRRSTGYIEHLVPHEDALLFHYRNWENPQKESFYEERRMFGFNENIIERIEHRLVKAKQFGYVDK